MKTIAQHHGTWRRWSGCLLCLLCIARAEDGEQHFIWKDGTSLSGRITNASAEELTITSPMFAQPVTLDLAALGEVKFGSSQKAEVETFLFLLADGMTVTGDLMEISNGRMAVRNGALGDFSLPLDEVLSIRRMTAAETFPLPDGWSPKFPGGSNPAPPSRPAVAAKPAAAPEGEMRRINLPERCDIVFKMRTVPKPDFRVIVTGANGQKVTLEAKNGDLILQGRLFFLIKNLEAVDGVVKLHLYWNQRTGRSVLCKAGGVCIAETTKGPVGEVSGGDAQGIRTQRATPADGIEYLGVSSWDDELPVIGETDGPGVLLTDESSMSGRVVGASGGLVVIQGPDGKTRSVPLGKVFRLRFAPVKKAPPKLQPVAFWFADGTHIDGRLTGIRDGIGTLESRLARRPVSFKSGALRQMVFRPGTDDAPPVAAPTETLTCGDVVLHGSVEDGAGGIHWRMNGARTNVPIARGLEFTITRKVESAAVDAEVFHLANGEVWSGKLTGMNRKEVEASWDFSEPFKVPAEQVRAIQFPADRINISGFKDGRWAPVTGPSSGVALSEKEVTLSGESTLIHPDAMRAGEIRFHWQPAGSYSSLQLRLFCSEDGRVTSGIPVRLSCNSGRLHIWLTDGLGKNRVLEVGAAAILTKPVVVRMQPKDDEIGIWVNDSPRFAIPASAGLRAGSGLMFDVKQSSNCLVIGAIVNGRAIVRRLNAEPIRIWDFSASTDTDQLRPAGGVPVAARLEALRIPRLRQDSQPRHLVVAANRDLLRGEIESVAAGHVRFRSGLEILRIPLDRLAAIVVPLPAVREADVPASKSDVTGGEPQVEKAEASMAKGARKAGALTFVMLNSGGRIGFIFEAIREGVMTGRHPLVGECRIPLAKVTRIDSHESVSLTAARSLDAWRWEMAPDPVLPETGGESSLLLGKEAAAFKLPLLGGGDFDLAQEKGKVVVLDFWATWCGPCVKSLPGIIDAMSAFPPDKVKLVGVNQGEGGEVVKRFLEARNLKLVVAMDGAQSVARRYGVEGIPHTVIIGRDGKIAWVKTGYSPEGATEAAATVKKLLTEP